MCQMFEQPLGRRNLEGLRALRQQTGLPVMADESCQTLRDAYELARGEAADVWNVYVSEAGGDSARFRFPIGHDGEYRGGVAERE